jgi:hypothetical protein
MLMTKLCQYILLVVQKTCKRTKSRYSTYMLHILYINPLLRELEARVCISGVEQVFSLAKYHQTAENFPAWILQIVDRYQITEIWCITGPGPFTLMRIVTLTLNTLAYTRSIPLKSCHFFDLILPPYRPILQANDQEYLTRIGPDVSLVLPASLPSGTYQGICTTIES